jgi:hypothetical protein
MSEWLVDRASAALERRTSRRSFLTKTAIVGSALVAAPMRYILRPVSAYAAVCNCAGSTCDCGSACCDGYTEFCCVLHGSNSCPPGTFTGGWWKADGTLFCSGDGSQPRYYIDCTNCAPCGCRCGGSCNNRATCCNQFRYGQCNQQMACTGYIDCRIVTCTAPWVFDPACTTASATDNRTAGHDAACLHLPPPVWHDWESLGAPVVGLAPIGETRTPSPDVTSWGAGRVDVFAQGGDSALWHRWYENGWHGWESLGGQLTGGPSATSWGPGRIDVFVRGNDDNLWHSWYDGRWFSFENLGSPPAGLAADPDATSWGPGRLDVFVRGNDGALWHKWYDRGWSGWESLGGDLVGGPAAASWEPGRVDVFVRGTDNGLWHKWYQGGWSQGFEPLGGGLSADPDATSWGPGRLDVVVRGTDKAAWHIWFADGRWSGFEGLGGGLVSGPGVSSGVSDRLDVVAQGNDNAIWHKWFGR